LLLVFVSATYAEVYLDILEDESASDLYLFYISLSFYFNITIMTTMLILAIFHFYLVCVN